MTDTIGALTVRVHETHKAVLELQDATVEEFQTIMELIKIQKSVAKIYEDACRSLLGAKSDTLPDLFKEGVPAVFYVDR